MSKMSCTDYPPLAFALVLLIGDSTDIFDGSKRGILIKGMMAKLQVYYMLKSPGFSPADPRNLEEALLRESVSHKNAFRAQIKSKDYYPKR